jgi:hypothetical protein
MGCGCGCVWWVYRRRVFRPPGAHGPHVRTRLRVRATG